MRNYKKHIDDFFREKLGRYAETPPADVWDSLDTRLDTLKPVVPGPSYRWLWHVGMVSVIAVLSVTVARKYMDGNATETVATRTTETVAPMIAATPVVPAASSSVNPDATAIGNVPAGGGDATAAANTAAAGSQPGNSMVAPATGNRQYAAGKPVAVVSQHVNGLNNKAATKLFSPSGNSSLAAKTQPGKSYNSSAPVNGSGADNAAGDERVTPTASPANQYNANAAAAPGNPVQATQTPEATKKPVPAADKKPIAKAAADKTHMLPPGFQRWQAGVKVGYEGGFDKDAASKLAIAPYLQYNLSPKFAIMVQPAVKFAKSATTTIGDNQSYYQKNEDGKTVQNGPSTPVSEAIGGGTVVHYETNYTFTQTHDSIVKSNTFGGTYMEYELPVLLKYNISHKVSVYGGINIIYSQTSGVTEHTYTKAGIVQSLDSTIKTPDVPTSTPASHVFSYNGTPYTNYHGPLYPNTQASQIRFGAMLGFSYEYSNRWLFDALIQQNPARTDKRGGYDINVPLSSTYLRFSVGYKLTK